MAVVSRIATLTFTGALGSRTWKATAVTQNTAEGQAVTINYTMTTDGAAPEEPSQNILVTCRTDSGAQIRQFSVPPGTATSALTFHFTNDGTSGGSARHGTVLIDIRVTKTNGGPTSTYDYETDGAPSATPTLVTATQVDRGYLVGTTEGTVDVSNLSVGGGKTTVTPDASGLTGPAAYGDSLYHRVVLGSPSYVARALTHVFVGTSKSLASSSTTSPTHTATFSGSSLTTGRVNEGFPAAEALYVATLGAVPNSSVTGVPYTTISVTTDSIDVDPRPTAVHLFQLDDNSVGTPPLSKQESGLERSSASIAYFATGLHHARGSVSGTAMTGGINGLSVTVTLTSDSNGDQISRTATTATEGGEPGWTTGFMQWTSPLPGGDWVKYVDITSPSDINADSYLLSPNETYVLLAARNPLIKLVVDAGHASATSNDRHLHVGDSIEVAAFLEFTKGGEEKLVSFEPGSTPGVAIKKVKNNNVEYWDGAAWQIAAPNFAVLPMTQQNDYIWTYVAPTDASWSDVTCQVFGQYLGVRYDGEAPRELVGLYARHDDEFIPNLLWIPIGSRGNHWLPGDVVSLSFTLFSPGGSAAPAFDADPELTVLRINAALATEFLDSDLTWKPFVDVPSSYQWPMPGGTLSFADTSSFDESDLIILATAEVNSEPYGSLEVIEVVSGSNRHDGATLDPYAIAGLPDILRLQ